MSEDKRAGKFQEALEEIAGLRKVVDTFFEKVMVMAEDEAVRKNRLALLSEIAARVHHDRGFLGAGWRRGKVRAVENVGAPTFWNRSASDLWRCESLLSL